MPTPGASADDHAARAVRSGLESFFRPKRVAVIGATEAHGSVGRTVLWNLISTPFGGAIYSVNPKRANVLGLSAYRSIADVPDQVDLAIIVTPASEVPQIVAECADAGVKGAIIVASGFRERGPEGAELEQATLAAARRGQMRILGPNCLGAMHPSTGLNATFAGAMARPGSVAFISQSGALCTAILDWSLREHIGFSSFMSIGSMLDVGWADLIDCFRDDSRTKSILLYMETIGDARSFISAAREVTLTKPIIVLKAGRTSAGARAAAAHTGAETGCDAVLDAAFARCGVLRVDTIADLFAMAEALASQPRPGGPRLTILTNAGGPGVLAADALADAGGTLAELAPETVAALDNLLPPHWSHSNPVDVVGDANPDRYARAFEIVARDPNTDGLLAVLTPQAMTHPTRTAEQLTLCVKNVHKPIIASWMGAAEIATGQSILQHAGIPVFAYPDTAARIFQQMWQYTENLRMLYETPSLLPDTEPEAPDRACVAQIIQSARDEGRDTLTTAEALQMINAYCPDVQTAASGDAYDLLLGSRIDSQFGPVLYIGAGGPAADVSDDLVFALPPLTNTLARRALEKTRMFAAIEQNTDPPVIAQLEQMIARFSQLVAEQRWISAIRILPLCVSDAGLCVTEARVTLHGSDVEATELPKTAIRPYPARYIAPWTLKDGTLVTLRPIRPEDEPLMIAFHQTLSERSIYLRYFRVIDLNHRVAHERLTRMCFIDYDRQMALVAVHRDPETGDWRLLGVGRLIKLRDSNDAEFALLISDASQGLGLGTELLQRLIQIGRDEGLDRIVGYMLPENRAMIHVCERLGFQIKRDLQLNEVVLEL
jgi:acetyl coenzyme A synthetase (ADP forming)-like protein